MNAIYQWFTEPFAYPFMQNALFTALLVSIICAMLSCYLVLKGWSLMGDAISHAVLPGIVVAFWLGLPLSIGAFVAGLTCSVCVGYLKENSRIKEDTAMGIVFSGMFALGIVLFSKIETDQHLTHILFGNLLGVSDAEMLQTLVISAVVFFSVSCKEESAQIGQPAPEIAAFDLQGNKASLSNWQGKTVLINFWSETCGACIAELKTLQQWAEKYPNQVQLVAMNIDGEKADTQAIVTKRQLTLPVFKDQMKITAERYQLVGTPTSFVIDPNGKLIYKFEGLLSEKDLQQLFTPTKINQGKL